MVDFARGARTHGQPEDAADVARVELTAAAVDRLGDEIAELTAHLDAATYRLLVRLREFDVREGWSGGFRSCAHWLSWRTGIAKRSSRMHGTTSAS